MDYPLSPKEKGTGFWQSPRPQLENSVSFEVTRSLNLEDSVSDLMNFDTDAGWYNSSSATDQILTSYGLSSFPSTPYGVSSDALKFSEQNGGAFPVNEVGETFNPVGNSFNCGDKLIFDQMDTQYGFSMDLNDANGLATAQNNCSFPQNSVFDMGNCMIPRPLSMSVDEKMLKALSLFKASSGGGILAQVWVPMRLGDQHILSTCEQPYLLDEMLAGYCEISRSFVFPTERRSGSFLGLPGHVFISKVPEWTSNVSYYNKVEYLRADHAAQHEVRGSIAVPVFDSPEMSCCAVLELVTTKEKSNFNAELETVCNVLQAVNLRTTEPPPLRPQCLSKNQRAALAEIIDVLRAVCHAHRLPLALTWIPCYYTEGADDEMTRVWVREGNTNSNERCILCIEETARYVNDRMMEGFVYACLEHHLEEGQGIAGKALQSNHPFFYADVKNYDIIEYPLVHHVHKFGLNATVSIRLRSTYTGEDDYILELFLPVNMKGSAEQQLLLNKLSGTMQRICKSLRTVSDAELFGVEGSKVAFQKEENQNFLLMAMPGENCQLTLSDNDMNLTEKMPLEVSNTRNDGIEPDSLHKQGNSPPPKPWERAGASSSSPAPFKPPSAGSTSDVVEASGTAKPGEIVSTSANNAAINRNTLGRPVPTRPWEQGYGNSTYGGYGSTMNYNSGYGSGMYGSSYGGAGGLYGGGGMYGNSMYRGGGYGGGLYGSSGMYGGGMYNSGLGGPMGGYGMGMNGPYGGQDPNDPYGAPPSPPGFWISALRVTQGVVNFFGRIAILIDQNTQAFHLFMAALLQLFDRSGMLYGELVRYVLRILGIRTKPKKVHPPGPNGYPHPGPHNYNGNQNYIEGPKAAPSGSWDNVWGNDGSQ